MASASSDHKLLISLTHYMIMLFCRMVKDLSHLSTMTKKLRRSGLVKAMLKGRSKAMAKTLAYLVSRMHGDGVDRSVPAWRAHNEATNG